MKFFLPVFFVLFFKFSLAQASRLVLLPDVQGSYQAGPIRYAFKLVDTELNKEVSDNDLVDSHTKKIHFIVYDPSLKEFSHVHPAFEGGVWKVDLNLPVDGNYFVWAQGELNDKTEFSISCRMQIINVISANFLRH